MDSRDQQRLEAWRRSVSIVPERRPRPLPPWQTQRTIGLDHHGRLYDPLQRQQGGGRGPGAR